MDKKEQDDSTSEEESITISQASSHKLHYIAQSLVNVLLASTALKKQIKIERKTAEQLFQHIYLTSCPASQLSTAALLSQSDDTYRWMPNFLADMLRKTLSSDPSTSLIPKDRWVIDYRFYYVTQNLQYCPLSQGFRDTAFHGVQSHSTFFRYSSAGSSPGRSEWTALCLGKSELVDYAIVLR